MSSPSDNGRNLCFASENKVIAFQRFSKLGVNVDYFAKLTCEIRALSATDALGLRMYIRR